MTDLSEPPFNLTQVLWSQGHEQRTKTLSVKTVMRNFTIKPVNEILIALHGYFYNRIEAESGEGERRREIHISMYMLSVQFRSVAQSYLTLCDPMNHSMTGLPVHHQLLEFTQTNVYRVGDAIQPSHSLSSPSPPAPNPSQHQGLFQ